MFEAILFTSVILCVIVSLLVYNSDANSVLKFVALPYTIILCVGVLWVFIHLTGAPIDGKPKGEWTYVSHSFENAGETIVLWSFVEDLEDYRLHRFPYDRETAKKLNQAREESSSRTSHKGKFVTERRGQPSVLYIEKHRSETENPPPKE